MSDLDLPDDGCCIRSDEESPQVVNDELVTAYAIISITLAGHGMRTIRSERRSDNFAQLSNRSDIP